MEIKLLRAEKRGRKIIIVFESELYSNETFAVNPFYDEGDEKNQLQAVHFDLKVTEDNGQVNAEVYYGSGGSHFTKGHTQLHSSLSSYFLDKKECAMDWIEEEKEEYFTKDRIDKMLSNWKEDRMFLEALQGLIKEKLQNIRLEKIKNVKERIKENLIELDNLV